LKSVVVARINQLSFALDGINEVALTSKFVVFFFSIFFYIKTSMEEYSRAFIIGGFFLI